MFKKFHNDLVKMVSKETGIPGEIINYAAKRRGESTLGGFRMAGNFLSRMARNRFGLGPGSKSKSKSKKSVKDNMAKRKRTRSKVGGKHHVARTGGKRLKTKSLTSKRRTKSLKARVSKLEKFGPKNAVHDYRRLDSSHVDNNDNQCAYQVMSSYNTSIRDVALDNLQYIDRGATPAPDVINLANTTYKTDIHFANFFTKLVVRNNNSIPAIVDVYCIEAKDDTSLTPVAAMQATDATYNVTDADTNIMLYPSDFDLFRRQFSIKKHSKATLQAGDELELTYSFKDRMFNPEMSDTLSTTYMKGDILWLIRVQGIVAHDATTEELVGFGDAHVDIVNMIKFQVKYPSDSVVRIIEVDNNLATLATSEAAGPAVDAAVTDDHN